MLAGFETGHFQPVSSEADFRFDGISPGIPGSFDFQCAGSPGLFVW
jgi:hypothetical protein